MKYTASVIGLIAAITLSTAAQAASFQNGSFETPGPVGARSDISTLAQAPTGWVPGGTLGNEALFFESNGWAGTPSQDGLYMIGFGGNGTTGATLSQTFDTVANARYTVTYFLTAQQVGNGPQSYTAEALSGVTRLGSESGSVPEASKWVSHSFDFVATGTSSTLRFTDTSNGPAALNINWGLDSVSVAAVPESSTLGLMSFGLAALAFIKRGKRRFQAF
jgi:hypothetical protein